MKSSQTIKVLVFSIAMNAFQKRFLPCIVSQKEYCARHGFDYKLLNRSKRKLSKKESAWLKIAILKECQKSDYDWFVFLDADCQVKRHAPDFRQEMDEQKSDKSIFMCHGKSGRINSGVIFAQNNNQTSQFFKYLFDQSEVSIPKEYRTSYENGHLIYHNEQLQAIHILNDNKWNNNATLDKDSFVQHYSRGELRKQYDIIFQTSSEPKWVSWLRRKLRIDPKADRFDKKLVEREILTRLSGTKRTEKL